MVATLATMACAPAGIALAGVCMPTVATGAAQAAAGSAVGSLGAVISGATSGAMVAATNAAGLSAAAGSSIVTGGLMGAAKGLAGSVIAGAFSGATTAVTSGAAAAGAAQGAATALVFAHPIGIAILGADNLTWDCWKPIVMDDSNTPSRGITLRDLCKHPNFRRLSFVNNGFVAENIRGENFHLSPLYIEGTLAFHATKQVYAPCLY